MTSSLIAMAIIFGIILLGAVIGLYAGFKREMNLEQWTVAGRGFGLILVWLLMAGEVYTTFAFLGASGWAYSRGGPTLYVIAYLTLCYVISFFILPGIWEAGRRHGLHTQSDFFRQRYGSTALSALVAVVGVVFIIPYLQLQLTGLGIIVQVASFDAISRPAPIASGRPSTSHTRTRLKVPRSTRRTTSIWSAPSAIRMPISLVLCATMYAVMP